MTATEATTGVPFVLNGKELEAEQGELLIDAADRHGVHIPRFCYHNRMKPVGMCRMCLVEVDTGRGMGLQPSCMLPVTPEMKVETESEATKEAQDGVLEFLLANHPLDCPVCDKGGECPLQDNAYAFGPGESRYVEEKRHYEKPIPISDLVHLDRERCILCDRCTRFAKEVAGDPLIHFIGRGSHTEVNTFPEHEFSSYFSGNTVQICPVGALTAAPYRFKARPWDLEAVESTSVVDGTGARTIVQSSRNQLLRVVGLDSDAVNWSWLSDKDRFAYEATNSENRITEPAVADGDGFRPVRWGQAARAAIDALKGDPNRVAAIGGARLSLESQYAWSKLLKSVVGTDHVDAQLGDGLPSALSLGLPRATINDLCRPGGVIVLLAPDPKEELPSLYLRIRHAVVEDGATLIEIGSRQTSLSSFAAVRLAATPGTVGQVMAALADGQVEDSIETVDAFQLKRAHDLLTGDRPVTVLFGRSNLAEASRYTADALGGMRRLNPDATYLPALRRGNLSGAFEMGLTPGFVPGGQRTNNGADIGWPNLPDFEGFDTDGILAAAADGQIDTLVLLGADPLADYPDAALAARAFEQVDTIIAVDCFATESASQADLFLPAAMFGETDGTFCNIEGRLSPIRAKVTAPGLARPDWQIAAEVASFLDASLLPETLAELRAEMAATIDGLPNLEWDALTIGAMQATDGPLFRPERNWDLEFSSPASAPTASQTGVRLVVDRKLWDNGTMVQESPALAGLAPKPEIRLAPEDAQLMNLLNAQRVTVEMGAASVELPFAIDKAVLPGTAWIAANLPDFDVREFLAADRSVVNATVRAVSGSEEEQVHG
jgi:NADH-quinone oxidoreductase subunit G